VTRVTVRTLIAGRRAYITGVYPVDVIHTEERGLMRGPWDAPPVANGPPVVCD